MKTIEELFTDLLDQMDTAESGDWQAVQGHEKRLCHEAHELQMLAGVLEHERLLDGGEALADLYVRLWMQAKKNGVPLLHFNLDGLGESRQVALRLAEELGKAHPEHDTCVLAGNFRLGAAEDMQAITKEDVKREAESGDHYLDTLVEEQTLVFTFAGSAILSVIEKEMHDLVAPDGDCNPSWLLYTILVGHRTAPLTAKEVDYLMSLSMDETVMARTLYGYDWRDARYGRQVLGEATSRGLMGW